MKLIGRCDIGHDMRDVYVGWAFQRGLRITLFLFGRIWYARFRTCCGIRRCFVFKVIVP